MLEKIESLYGGKKSVVLIGHSMGGVIARSIATKRSLNVPIVITLASPHLMPVLDIDAKMHSYYSQIDSLDKHVRTTFVSIAGGDGRDSQVTSSLTRFPGNMTSQRHVVQVEAASVPRVHAEADHQCIVWCKQLQLVIARFLYACVDDEKVGVVEKPETRNQIANFYFNHNTGFSNTKVESSKVALKPTYAWKEINSACWASRAFKSKKNSSGTYFTFSIKKFLNQNKNEFVARTVLSNNAWIMGCSIDSNGQCIYADDLTTKKGILVNFSKVDNYNIVHLDLEKLQHEYTHIVVPVSKFRFNSDLDVNIIENNEVLTDIETQYLISYFYNFISPKNVQLVDLGSQCKNRFYRKVAFRNFETMTQVYWTALSSSKQRNYFSRTEIGWDKGAAVYTKSNEDLSESSNDMIVTVRSNPPPNSDKSVYVHYYAAGRPVKNDKLNLSYNYAGGLFIARILRHFGSFLIVFTVTSALFVLSFQFDQATQRKSLSKIEQAHFVSADLLKIQPWLLLPYHFLSKFPSMRNLYSLTKLPLPEVLTLESCGMWSILVPITTFFFSLEIFRLFNFLNLLVIHLARFTLLPIVDLTLRMFRVPRLGKISSLTLHVTVLACLIGFHSFLAFVYCYAVALARGARARNEMVKFNQQPTAVDDLSETKSQSDESDDSSSEELSGEGDAVSDQATEEDLVKELEEEGNLEEELEKGEGYSTEDEQSEESSAEGDLTGERKTEGEPTQGENRLVEGGDATPENVSNNESNKEPSLDNLLKLNKPPPFKFDETTKSEDVFASSQSVINILMWLVVLTLPSFVAHARDDGITFYESVSDDANLLPAVLLVVAFVMMTLKPDVTELPPDADEYWLGHVSKLVKYSPVLMVVYSCVSIYRAPYFVLVMLIARYSAHFL